MTSDSVPPPAVEPHANILQFFHGAVKAARHEAGIDATDVAQSYIAGLLTDFARPDAAYDETLARPLTLLLLEAQTSSGAERFARLRTLGDGVLFLSGFFPEHFESRGVEPNYLASLGSRAYSSAAQVLGRGGAKLDVFQELAVNFRTFVRLLGVVADTLATHGASDAVTVALYERWLKTGSQAAAKALSARGLIPGPRDGTLH